MRSLTLDPHYDLADRVMTWAKRAVVLAVLLFALLGVTLSARWVYQVYLAQVHDRQTLQDVVTLLNYNLAQGTLKVPANPLQPPAPAQPGNK